MFRRVTKGLAAVAALTTLAAWFGVRPSEAKEWPGPYDQAARRYYAEEERDYRALGYDATGTGRAGNSRPYYPYYGAYSQPAPAPDNAARIRVIVPAEAKVWFDNKPTTQAGPERRFESPALTPGRRYTYDVKAQWHDQDGKDLTRTRQVDVSANADVTVDLTR
jgi:uncharacterized protein (TIGR03000 family)